MAQGQNAVASEDTGSYLQARLRQLPLFARELIAGGCAGGLAKTCVAPLERTKIIFQTRGGSGMTVGGVLSNIWQHDGLQGLFRGNTASVMRIVPYAAIHFGLYEYYRRGIIQLMIPNSQPGSPEQGLPVWDLLAGSASGATAVLATYPLDLVRTRLAWATETPAATGAHAAHRSGIWSQLVSTMSEEGIVGLYRGCTPTLLGILPYAGLKFYVYQALKNHYRGWLASAGDPSSQAGCQIGSNSSRQDDSGTTQHQSIAQQQPQQNNSTVSDDLNCSTAANNVLTGSPESTVAGHQQQQQQQGEQQQDVQVPNKKLPVAVTLMFGGIAGLAAQTVTYPLDVIRRQMQVAHLRHPAHMRDRTLAAGSTSSSGGRSSGSSNTSVAPKAATPLGSGSGRLPVHELAAGHSSDTGSSNRMSSSNSWHMRSSAGSMAADSKQHQGYQQQRHNPAVGTEFGTTCSGSRNISSVVERQYPHSITGAGYAQIAAGDSRGMSHHHTLMHDLLHPEPTMRAVTRRLLSEGGVRALFRGLSINYLKVAPSTAIGFTVYDAFKAYLGLTSTL